MPPEIKQDQKTRVETFIRFLVLRKMLRQLRLRSLIESYLYNIIQTKTQMTLRQLRSSKTLPVLMKLYLILKRDVNMIDVEKNA